MTNTLIARFALASVMSLALTTPVQAGAIHDAGLFTNTLAANDDGSTGLVDIGFTIDFYGTSRDQLYVNNNGNVTFDTALDAYTPFGITNDTTPMLAPFFADVDTRAGNLVSYGTGTIGGRNVFGVNWIEVGYYSYNTDKLNSFQLIITDRSDLGAGNFDFEFNYDMISWETGDASQGVDGFGGSSAHAGWTNGNGTFYEFPGSGVTMSFLDNGPNALTSGSRLSNTPGQYIFEVRNGQVQPPTSNVPEPTTLAILGLGLGCIGFMRRRNA